LSGNVFFWFADGKLEMLASMDDSIGWVKLNFVGGNEEISLAIRTVETVPTDEQKNQG
jgi:hypothetical protein